MSPKEIYYFLGRCLILGESPQAREEVIQGFAHPSFSWEQFVRVGSSHLVLPSLYVKLREEQLLSDLPEDLVVHLAEIFRLNTERNQNLLRQIHWLVALLEKAGIKPILLKGSGALLTELYPELGERVITDIDCLVPDRDFDRAIELLKNEGYQSPPFHPASLPMMHHYPSLFKNGEPAKIEIHRIPVGRRQMKYMDLDSVNKQSLIPESRDQVLINVIHSQLKDKGQYYANIPLRNIYEFYRLSKRQNLSQLKITQPRLKMVLNNYMAVANNLFSPAQNFPIEKRLRTSLFLLRFDLNKSSKTYYKCSRTIRNLADLLHSYFHIFTRALTQKDFREYLGARLGNPAWYGHHLKVIKKRFSPPA